MNRAKLYYGGRYFGDLTPYTLPKREQFRPEPFEVVDMPAFVKSQDGDYYAKFSGTVWRLVADTRSYIGWFPTEELAQLYAHDISVFYG